MEEVDMDVRPMMPIDTQGLYRLCPEFDPKPYTRRRHAFGLVGEIGEAIVGYVACDQDGDIVEIADIYVGEPVRRNGIGSALLECVSHRIDDDCSIEAAVPQDKDDIQRFFGYNAYSVVSEGTRDGIDIYLFRKGWRFRQAPQECYR